MIRVDIPGARAARICDAIGLLHHWVQKLDCAHETGVIDRRQNGNNHRHDAVRSSNRRDDGRCRRVVDAERSARPRVLLLCPVTMV